MIIANNKKMNTEIKVFNKPKFVYIPLISGNDTNITVLVNKGEYVYKGSIIGKRKGDFRIPIHSSVSGIVVDFEEKTCLNGTLVKCVVIENDFKEKILPREEVKTKYTKEEFIECLKENGIVGMGGSGFPTYIKYDVKKIKTLIVNGVECEPYLRSDYVLAYNKCEEILEAIDTILEINNIDEAIIVFRKNNNDLKELFDNYIGTYLKIKIVVVSNDYPNGWERQLISKVMNIEYNNLPIEQGIVVSNISTIYAIYEALKYNKPLIERVITFTGDGFKKPCNMLVKIGTKLSDIINEIGINDNTFLVAGGPMMGVKVDEELVVSANLNGVLCLNEKEDKRANPCIKCGKCVSVCPAKLSPVLIMENFNNKKELIPLKPQKCVECGLCSYICPANILVREYVKKAKREVG